MSAFSFNITLGRPEDTNKGGMGSTDGNDPGFECFEAPDFSVKAGCSPELSVFHVERCEDGSPAEVMLVFGNLIHAGRMCNEESTASAFLKDWNRFGSRMLNGVDGSFLIIIHDVRKQHTSLITDPCGSRPIWFIEGKKAVYFGNNPRELALNAGMPVEPDPAWLWSMLNYKRTVGECSSLKGVRGLPPGVVCTFSDGEMGAEVWFDFEFKPNREQQSQDFGQEFYNIVKSTISMACEHSDSPSLLLSGGLDSRLLASACPESVHCITLCDSYNREVLLAQKVASSLDLSHDVIVRPPDWYPNLLEPSCMLGGGVWLWDQGHFLPMGDSLCHFDFDTTMLGYGADTLFKGKDIDWSPLWNVSDEVMGDEEALCQHFLTLLEQAPDKSAHGELLLNRDFAEHCKEEFITEALREFRAIQGYCRTFPDMWQSFWSRNLARAGAMMNLVSLRPFTNEFNIFTTASMQKFHLSLPVELRRSGVLPLMALQASGQKRLLEIPDANTWLPYTYPQSLHAMSISARKVVAKLRAKRRMKSSAGDYKSNCSWPHNGRLWIHSKEMSDLMTRFIEEKIFDEKRFNPTVPGKIWQDHLSGAEDHSGALDFMATYGCVFGGN